MTEEQAKASGRTVRAGLFSFAALGKAMAAGTTDGFIKWVADATTDQLLGAQAVGPHATELIATAALAVHNELTALEFGHTIHSHPTLSEAWMEAAHAVHGTCIHAAPKRKRTGAQARFVPRAVKLTTHRNLFNGDCTYLFTGSYGPEAGQPFTIDIIRRFIKRLGQSGVDTYLCNVNAQKPWYPSKVLPTILDGYTRGSTAFVRDQYPPLNDTDFGPEKLAKVCARSTGMLDRYLDLAEAGVDWVAEMSKACRQNGISPWASVRMNDAHGANSWEHSFMNCRLQQQARYRLSGRVPGAPVPNPFQQLLDYGHREVRDYYFTMIRELIEDYDHEGLELDWLRTPFCCEPPADAETQQIMTDWVRQIRALADKRARSTNRPFTLGLRVPVRLDLLKNIGLDVGSMARQGLIDYVALANFWQTSWDVPYDSLRRELGDEVAIYGVLDNAPNALPACNPETGQKSAKRLLSTSAELLRGNAAGKLALGADGVYTFNFFCSDDPLHVGASRIFGDYAALSHLESPEFLRGRSKQYALASRPGLYEFPLWEFADQVPRVLEANGWASFRFSALSEAEGMSAKLHLVIDHEPWMNAAIPHVGISLNGSWPCYEGKLIRRLLFTVGGLSHHADEHIALAFEVDASLLRDGWNEVLVNGDPGKPVRVVGVELGVFDAEGLVRGLDPLRGAIADSPC